MNVPLVDLMAHRDLIGADIDEAILRAVQDGKWIMGPEVASLETALTARVGSGNVGDDTSAIACANGTDALVLAMQALGLASGQAVICPAFTFVATAEAVAALGGIPVFADAEDHGFNLSVESTRMAIKTAQQRGLEVAGVVAVDLFGLPADYEGLHEVADEANCWVLSDAAQAFGASHQGVPVGRLASVTTTSFFPAKPLGCYGDGGAVFTTDPDIDHKIRSLRVHGKGDHKYDNVAIGQNSRLDTLQAAVLLQKLTVFDQELQDRDRIAQAYTTALGEICSTPQVPDGSFSAWAQYTISVPDRQALMEHLSANGVASAVYYPKPLHTQPGYQAYVIPEQELTRSEWLADHVLSLPMHPYLTDAQIDQVIDTVATGLRA